MISVMEIRHVVSPLVTVVLFHNIGYLKNTLGRYTINTKLAMSVFCGNLKKDDFFLTYLFFVNFLC
jgi:hypothetical protein